MNTQINEDDNVVQFPKRDHTFANKILMDPRLNITARLAWLLTGLCALKGHTQMRRSLMIEMLGTNERQFYYSIEALVKLKLFRISRKESSDGAKYVWYYPVLDDDEELFEFTQRIQTDPRLDLCTRLHWSLVSLTENCASTAMSDRDLARNDSIEAVRRARQKMKKLPYFDPTPGRGRTPTNYLKTFVRTAESDPAGDPQETRGGPAGDPPHRCNNKEEYRNKNEEGLEANASNARRSRRARENATNDEPRDKSSGQEASPRRKIDPSLKKLRYLFFKLIPAASNNWAAFQSCINRYGIDTVATVLGNIDGWDEEPSVKQFMFECFHESPSSPSREKSRAV